jgi:hypothetical protein
MFMTHRDGNVTRQTGFFLQTTNPERQTGFFLQTTNPELQTILPLSLRKKNKPRTISAHGLFTISFRRRS